MNFKKYIQLSLVAIFPYSILLALYCIFTGFLMESVFQNNGYLLLFYLLVLWAIAFVCAMVTACVAHSKKWDAYEMTRINMVIKLIQMPAYILIFIVGALCAFTIFTIGISVALIILDCMAIVLSGVVGFAAMKRNYEEELMTKKSMRKYAVLQFIFVADVISAVKVCRKTKKELKKRSMEKEI